MYFAFGLVLGTGVGSHTDTGCRDYRHSHVGYLVRGHSEPLSQWLSAVVRMRPFRQKINESCRSPLR